MMRLTAALLAALVSAAAAAQEDPVTMAAIVQQMASLQQQVNLVKTENADLRLELADLAKRKGVPNAQFGVSSLGQSRRLQSAETCCRWTPGETCQTTEEVCTMVHEYIEGKALTVECGATWQKCPERSPTHAEPGLEPSAGLALPAYAQLRLLHRPDFSMPRTLGAWAATRMRGSPASTAPLQM